MMLRRLASSQLQRQYKSITSVGGSLNFSTSDIPDLEISHYNKEWKTYGDIKNYTPGKFVIQTFNKISEKGLQRFEKDSYEIGDVGNAHAILLRSHKLQEEEVLHTVRAIARCGAGTNNIPVPRMTELGVPVFNTPGANANAVKELVLCGLFLGSRRVHDGINHMKDLGEKGQARERVEKDKALFGGREIKGKTIAVIGLGHIGSSTAVDAAALGMDVVGYDPGLSIESALKLPDNIALADSILAAVSSADYISINIPYIKGEGGTHGVISKEIIGAFKPGAVILNFARGELVDSASLKDHLDNNDGRYVSDFPDDELWDHKNSVIIPHLGASTEEAEDAAAAMAAETIKDYLESGTIKNSVNFPTTSLPEQDPNVVRFTVVNKNKSGMLAKITEVFAESDFNIVQQINNSKKDIAYNVVDVDTAGFGEVMDFKKVQKKITMLDGVMSSRVIYSKLQLGTGYAKNVEGKYFV